MEILSKSVEERSELVSRIKWAMQVNEVEAKRLARFLLVYSVAEGEVVFQEGDDACYLGLIASGKLRIEKSLDQGEQKKIAVLNSGEVFGEMALIDGKPRSASAYAEEDSVLLFLNNDNYEALLTEYPRIGVKLLTLFAHTMSQRLRQTSKWLIDALSRLSEE